MSANTSMCYKNPQNKRVICFWVSQEKDLMELDFEWEDVKQTAVKKEKHVPSI